MTAFVQVTIRCDWCGHNIVRDAPGAPRFVRPENLDAAIEAARVVMETSRQLTGLADAYIAGHRWPSPPGMQLDLCRQCINRGTPPQRLPPRTTRRRKKKP